MFEEPARHETVDGDQDAVVQRTAQNLEVREVGGWVPEASLNKLLRNELEMDLRF